MTYYDILGVSETASQEEIEAAYRQRVKETHPDQSDHPNAAQLFMQVQEAYDVLSDPEKREQYDDGGTAAAQSAADTSATGAQGTASTKSESGNTTQGPGWKAYTRNADGADTMWDEAYETSQKPPHVTEASGSGVTSLAGSIVMMITGGGLGLTISVVTLYILNGGIALTTGLGAVVAAVVLFPIVLIATERFIGTHRRIG